MVKFNQSLIDHSANATAGTKSVIDGILLTKFDCIDDKVSINFVYSNYIVLIMWDHSLHLVSFYTVSVYFFIALDAASYLINDLGIFIQINSSLISFFKIIIFYFHTLIRYKFLHTPKKWLSQY